MFIIRLLLIFIVFVHVYIECDLHNRNTLNFTLLASSRRSKECKFGSKNCVCLGTENERSQITTKGLNHYARLKKSFINCEQIVGNLELTHIESKDLIIDETRSINSENETVVEREPPFHFLKDLIEISGYLYVFNVDVKSFSIPKLRIIFGEKKINGNALIIESSPNLRYFSLPGLRSIENGNVSIRMTPNLCEWDPKREGKNSVSYSEFLGGENYLNRLTAEGFNATCESISCAEECDGICFGPDSNQCQIAHRRNCGANCPGGSCYITDSQTYCCHESCTGGCFGQGNDKCVACKYFNEDGRCVQQCRGIYDYDPLGMVKEMLPETERRYSYGRFCTNKCPSGMLVEDKYCVAHCSPGYYRNVDDDETLCVPCQGVCPKVCQLKERVNSLTIHQLANCTEIEGSLEILSHAFEPHLPNLKQSRRSTSGMIPALDPSALDILKTVRIITGHVLLDGGFKNHSFMPTSMSFLENLEMIEGRYLYNEKFVLSVIGNPNLKWAGLKSLRKIKNGIVAFSKNKNLCYSYTVPFKRLFGVEGSWIENMNEKACMHSGRHCDSACDSEYGCWGPGPKLCVKCKHFTRDDACSETCPKEGTRPNAKKFCSLFCSCFELATMSSFCCIGSNYFVSRENPTLCLRCHPQCSECYGSASTDCKTCHNFEHWTSGIEMMNSADDETRLERQPVASAKSSSALIRSYTFITEKIRRCVEACPNATYASGKRCEPCHEACYGLGCTGPTALLGQGGCNRCLYGVEDEENRIRCLTGETEASVCHEPSNGLASNYVNALGPPNVSKFMCRKCPPECRTCTRESVSAAYCDCANFRLISGIDAKMRATCVLECGKGSYEIINATTSSLTTEFLLNINDAIATMPLTMNGSFAGICVKCHSTCDERFSCSGVSATDCERCAVGGVPLNETIIECLHECPVERPFPYEGMCHEEDKDAIARRKRNATVGIAIISAVVFAMIIAYLIYRCTKYRKKYEKEAQMHLPEIPALDPRKVTQRPNMRRLNLIGVDELDDSKNNVLGQGAFGTVYAGKWKPPNRKNISIPVAIKVINKNEARHTTEAEMMKEAGLMASIQHEHLLPLVGICVAKDGVKIVTILRPLGSLLKFLKEHKDRLGSKSLMLYAYQISSAMEFLARKKIVHRDLATRNVLVKNINHVEVTDFGLAQMLQGCDTSIVIDGRVAVKWLAIESLRQQIYTERTDVWSFGVTCWEILTFGGTPYNELRLSRDTRMARDLASHLEKGYRLVQPANCSQELYQEMLNCWLNDPDSRPSFRQLKERFELFCRAPHIYIQEKRTTQRMDSITSSDQRQMIERLLQDADFLDPVNLDIADYGQSINGDNNRSCSSTSTMETTLPPNSPCTPTRPLMSGERQGSTTTSNSSRYKADPMARRYRLSADDSISSTRTSETEMLDDDNYLMPRSGVMRSIIGASIDEAPNEEENELEMERNNTSLINNNLDDANADYLPTYLNELADGEENINVKNNSKSSYANVHENGAVVDGNDEEKSPVTIIVNGNALESKTPVKQEDTKMNSNAIANGKNSSKFVPYINMENHRESVL